MSVTNTTSAALDTEPFFGDRGNVIRIQKTEVRPRLGGVYFFVWPLIGSLISLVIVLFLYPELLSGTIFLIILVDGYFAFKYLNRNIQPGMGFEITEDSARLYHFVDSVQLVSEVSFKDTTLVDVDLNPTTRSEEYGHLFGWVFEEGEYRISICAHEGWELWDIQNLREPVLKVIEHNGCAQGKNLRFYEEGLRGVIPLRSRGH